MIIADRLYLELIKIIANQIFFLDFVWGWKTFRWFELFGSRILNIRIILDITIDAEISFLPTAAFPLKLFSFL